MSRYRSQKKQKSFEEQMMDTGRIPNLAAALIIATYTMYFAGIPFQILGRNKTVGLITFAVVIVGILQFVVAPRTNHILTVKIAQMMNDDEEHGLSDAERTDLVKRLMRCPVYICLECVFVFLFGVGIWILSFYFVFGINLPVTIFSLVACLYGSFNAGVLGYTYAEQLCSKYACLMVERGVDDAQVRRDQFYGPATTRLALLYIIAPVILENVIQFFVMWKGYRLNVYANTQIINMLFVVVMNTALSIVLSSLLYSRIIKSTRQINSSLEQMNNGSLSGKVYLPTNLGDETAYSLYLVNSIVRRLGAITGDAAMTSRDVLDSTQELSVSSKETAATSVEQAAGVKECVSTMEDSEALSRNLSSRIADVADAASQTSRDVEESFAVLTGNMQKMTEITEANLETITGIKALSEKIESVWSVVNIINTIADKTRIIAFNAELEAATAGESGQNFHIVANEIRRLAATITDSTREIRDRITEIQHSSDNLIITSEGGTEKIREGSELYSALEEKFSGIRTSSEITAESAADIQQIIDEQAASFTQIVTTLQQISAGIDNFSHSTQTISTAADNLRQIAAQLEAIQPHSQAGA